MRKSVLMSLLVVLMISSHIAQPVVGTQIGGIPRVNAPYFDGGVRFSETAIFWFGRVTPTENYADVRVGYDDGELYVRLAAFDRRLWRDAWSSPAELTAWDAATLYLDLDGNVGSAPDANAYRFVVQLSGWRPPENYQTAYRGDGSGWVTAAVPFTGTTGWRGNAPNDDQNDRGWAVTFHIPFASLGLSAPPSRGTVWGMAMILHDRDDDVGTPIADKTWPEAMSSQRPGTWGQLRFGLPTYTPPLVSASETITIRHKLGGATVMDASVGGYTVCGRGVDFWAEWGETNEVFYNPERSDFNIQNQSDVADWPCFSKYYVTFPLDAIPPGKAIASAMLTLHQFGGAGAPGDAERSLVQVLTVAEDWDDTTLTWNNAPLAVENVSATWVGRPPFPGWPGNPFTWDVSRAVAEAHAAGEPLRLALYEADSAYHSGKYFVSSNTGDWNTEGRPALTVVYGEPVGMVDKYVHPVSPGSGEIITYTVVVLGSGHALTLIDTLPDGLSDPGPIQVTDGSAVYHSIPRRVEWNGAPDVGQPVTIAFPVTVQVSGPVALVNTAALTDAVAGTSTDTAVVIVGGLSVYLPLVARGWQE